MKGERFAGMRANFVSVLVGGILDDFFDNEITDDEWFFDMGGKTLQQKLEEIKVQLAKIFSKIKEVKMPEVANSGASEKFHIICDYFVSFSGIF